MTRLAILVRRMAYSVRATVGYWAAPTGLFGAVARRPGQGEDGQGAGAVWVLDGGRVKADALDCAAERLQLDHAHRRRGGRRGGDGVDRGGGQRAGEPAPTRPAADNRSPRPRAPGPRAAGQGEPPGR